MTDNRGTAIHVTEILNRLKVTGKILAVGDSALPHAILNLHYFQNNESTVCTGINCDPLAVGTYDHFTVIHGNGNNMPFEDDAFDCVITVMLFEHDLYFWKTVEEIKRVLKPGGVYIMTVPAFVDEKCEKYVDGTITYMLHEAKNVDDFYRFSEKAVTKFFFSGFKNVVTKRYQTPPRIIVYGFLDNAS